MSSTINPKFLANKDKGKHEFDFMHAHKKQEELKESKEMIVEEIISKDHTQIQPSAELGPIEKRIME
jgi:hypothetical protein